MAELDEFVRVKPTALRRKSTGVIVAFGPDGYARIRDTANGGIYLVALHDIRPAKKAKRPRKTVERPEARVRLTGSFHTAKKA